MDCVHPPLVVEPWLLLAHQSKAFSLRPSATRMVYYHLPLPLTLWRIICAGPHSQSRIFFSGALVPIESTPEFVTCGCGCGWVVMLQCGLKLFTGCAGSGAFHGVQNKVSHCLFSAWGHQHEWFAEGYYLCWYWRCPAKLSCKPKLAAANAGDGEFRERYRAHWNQVLLVWEILGKSEELTNTALSYGKAILNGLGGPEV